MLAAKIPSCGAGRSLESSTGFRRLRWGSCVENLPLGLYSSNSRTLEKNVLTGNVFPRRRQMFTEPFIIRPSHFASRKRTVYVHAASRRNKSLKILLSILSIRNWKLKRRETLNELVPTFEGRSMSTRYIFPWSIFSTRFFHSFHQLRHVSFYYSRDTIAQ